jgi:outer membrane protein OmpA-like peptidoglycan-associated protein
VFRLLAGLHYTYERKEAPPREEGDRDGDGLRDDVDKCPEDPEDKDGFQDGDGCPDPDNDGDRIPDAKDVCPDDVEDPDGFKDDDGCPDPDNDGDGMTDANDRCPNEPEDRDGFQDEDGCADLDNDGDRVPDAKDTCPDEPETVNGVNDEDGCPDTQMTIVQGKIDVPTVYFATNRDEILAKSFPVLEALADTLKKNLWVKRVRIEGHTDDRGRAELNLDLSKRRARSVLEFLVKQGVERDRLLSEGYGKGQPIASNKTADGRAKNRRVDFVIVDPPSKK